jgi:hypothetical protein
MEAAGSPPPWQSQKLTYDLDGDLADLEVPVVEPFSCETDRNEEVGDAVAKALATGSTSGRLEVVEECGFHGRGPDTFNYFEWAIVPECPKDKAWFAEQTEANPGTPPGMPLHPTNAILVRLTKAGRAEVDHATLYAWLLYTFNRGYFRRLACGTCQQCIRLRDVKDVPIEGGRKLKNIATFRAGVDPDSLKPGDILLQRVGTREGCGRPYVVVGTDPLSTRGHGFRGGRAAGRLPRDFDAVQLERGTIVEMEHTTSRRVAQRIAMDHLTEHPDYYVELAKMEAMLRARRRDGNPWVGLNPGPAPEDWNYYINFVLYAVLGRMGEADGLMRQYGNEIRGCAEVMRATQPVSLSKLYRGLLLEPQEVRDGSVRCEFDESGEPSRTFLSFSENEDVACWFARPDSIMSGFVRQQRPAVQGYLTTLHGSRYQRRLIWHHSWQAVPLPGRSSDLPLFAAARAHPHIDEGQFIWNMQTQSEVLLEASKTALISVKPIGDEDCPDTDELDARFTYPPFLDQYVQG